MFMIAEAEDVAGTAEGSRPSRSGLVPEAINQIIMGSRGGRFQEFVSFEMRVREETLPERHVRNYSEVNGQFSIGTFY
jgi:hypothetical protein